MRVGPAQNAMPSRLIRMLESWAEPRTYRLRLLVDVIIDQEGHDRSSQAWVEHEQKHVCETDTSQQCVGLRRLAHIIYSFHTVA